MAETKLKQKVIQIKGRIERKIAVLVPSRIHPNHLTSFRLAVILLLPVAEFYALSAKIVFWLAVLGALSDSLDGITARPTPPDNPPGHHP